jgi:hypothetical protein
MSKSIYPWADYPELNGGPKSAEHEGRFSGMVKPSGKSSIRALGNTQSKANEQNIKKN